MRKYCKSCGQDITQKPKHHYLCYGCWKENDSSSENDISYSDDSLTTFTKKYNPNTDSYEVINPTYEERYKGDSDYDMGPNWDYDEYPPENLFSAFH